jgi:hypothetical protein
MCAIRLDQIAGMRANKDWRRSCDRWGDRTASPSGRRHRTSDEQIDHPEVIAAKGTLVFIDKFACGR